MTDGSTIPIPVADRLSDLRSRIAVARQRNQRLLEQGATGIQVASAISQANDSFVVELFEEAVVPLSERQRELVVKYGAVVAVGGSGRGDMAPQSDVDLLFLHEEAIQHIFADLSGQLVRDCWDAGIKLGHSVQTVSNAMFMARTEAQFATSLIEARLLIGSQKLLDKLLSKFRKLVRGKRKGAFLKEWTFSRLEERDQYGAAVGRLEPDVKRSTGGLRDLHLIRWIGYLEYGVSDLESLRLKGGLRKEEFRRLLAAWEFLTKLRIEMHAHAGKPNDLLTREEQLRISESREIDATAGLRPVEQFMRTYFRHTTAIAQTAERFVEVHSQTSYVQCVVDSLVTHRTNSIYKVGPTHITVPRRYLPIVGGSIERMLELWRSAQLYSVRPTADLRDYLTQSVASLDDREISEEAASRFCEILGRGGSLGAVLRCMYRTGLLERIIPQMSHARCLLQFNQYHSYTVDEHTLRAVEIATTFADDPGSVGGAYRNIRHKEIVHLALLLHDIGKGYEEDHSIVGARIAEEVAHRLHMPAHQTEQIVFLVRQHLMMSNVAFRRDISDPETLVQFAREVGSPDTLRMLYVLTAADISAVGPGVWNDWKSELLTNLFDRAMLAISGKSYQEDFIQQIDRIRDDILSDFSATGEFESPQMASEWLDRQLKTVSDQYLIVTPPQQIARDLLGLKRLKANEIEVEWVVDRQTATIDYRILADESFSEGCFHKVAGALAAARMEILSAQICTCSDGRVVDVFRVADTDGTTSLDETRISGVATSIRDVLSSQTTVEELFKRFKRFTEKQESQPLSDLRTRVVIDNESSERGTIIDIFAHDRRGLLYTISRTLYDLELSVVLAKIATRLDQIVDVFYVTDMDGKKIKDGERLTAIRAQLKQTLAEFEREGYRIFRA